MQARFNWLRNPAANHGHVFKDCTFVGIDEPLPWTRDANGDGQKSKIRSRAATEQQRREPSVRGSRVINSRMKDVSPEVWGPIAGQAPVIELSG